MKRALITFIFAVLFSARHDASAAQFTEGTSKKIANQSGTFSVSFPVLNNQKTPLVIGSVKTSHWKCRADFTTALILPGKTGDVLSKGKNFDRNCGKKDGKKHSNHTVLIAGSRINPDTKKCELLVRNSWGNYCGSYSSEWSCEAAKGSVWIDAQALGDATRNYTVTR